MYQYSFAVGHHYNAVKYNMILNTAIQWLTYNLDETLNSQQTPHTSHSQMNYGMSILSILEKVYNHDAGNGLKDLTAPIST